MTLRDDFLADVRAFLALSQMEPSTFGSQVMNDPNFVFEVEYGRAVRLDTVENVRGFMADRQRPLADLQGFAGLVPPAWPARVRPRAVPHARLGPPPFFAEQPLNENEHRGRI
jgi:hypothetical protein